MGQPALPGGLLRCRQQLLLPAHQLLPVTKRKPPLHCCSGVDGLAYDPLAGSWALTPAAYAAAAAQAQAWGAPLLLLGGGGYNSPGAAAAWAGVLGALCGRQLADDIPEHEFFERYGPAFTLSSGKQGAGR